MATDLLETIVMKRTALLALVSLSLLAGCASSGATGDARSYSVVPKVQVTERVPKKRTAQVSYQARPEESPLSGSGGSAR
ncbi:hypothetical protein [Anaeromyxobacter oryzae]|uniref:Lipoprotein n=1 Tax=Anaeromyxobacter oryzae TaxID=2918170 RepID=A0ABM7WWY8_9BACT|nr:hypothetical protein [Anaeromyxobacter oryzae]BDG03991.1 hypothetical protein AMOR_29870 [Anaeromyxobacter oryzae]